MADDVSLRQLLASFVVEVDKAGELAKGNAAIDALKAKLEGATAVAPKLGKALDAVFSKMARNASRAVNAIAEVDAARALTGRVSNNGFFAAGLAQQQRLAPQLGPTRARSTPTRARSVGASTARCCPSQSRSAQASRNPAACPAPSAAWPRCATGCSRSARVRPSTG